MRSGQDDHGSALTLLPLRNPDILPGVNHVPQDVVVVPDATEFAAVVTALAQERHDLIPVVRVEFLLLRLNGHGWTPVRTTGRRLLEPEYMQAASPQAVRLGLKTLPLSFSFLDLPSFGEGRDPLPGLLPLGRLDHVFHPLSENPPKSPIQTTSFLASDACFYTWFLIVILVLYGGVSALPQVLSAFTSRGLGVGYQQKRAGGFPP